MTYHICLTKERLSSMVCNGTRTKVVTQHPVISNMVDAEIIVEKDSDLQIVILSDDQFIREETLKKMRA